MTEYIFNNFKLKVEFNTNDIIFQISTKNELYRSKYLVGDIKEYNNYFSNMTIITDFIKKSLDGNYKNYTFTYENTNKFFRISFNQSNTTNELQFDIEKYENFDRIRIDLLQELIVKLEITVKQLDNKIEDKIKNLESKIENLESKILNQEKIIKYNKNNISPSIISSFEL